MKISTKQWDSALFNLDSMRTKLMNERDEAYERACEAFAKKDQELSRKLGDEADEIEARIDEVEELLGKMHFGSVTRKEWDRIQSIVAERQYQRYAHCIASGMDEQTAAGAFED